MAEKGMTGGKIGGVACSSEYIEGLFDTPESLFETQHYFCVQAPDGKMPFTNEELRQIIRELSIGIYVHGTVPFFSLHFRQGTADLFPVIHPAYQNTLVGRVISMLDYFMKGYLNGGVFSEKFIDGWHQNPNWKSQQHSALQELIDFERYCLQLQGDDKNYASLKSYTESFSSNSLLNALLGKLLNTEEKPESKVLSEFEGFRNSFRIIAKQNSFQKSGNVFVVDADFDVEYTIEPSPTYAQELGEHQRKHGDLPASYSQLVKAFEIMKIKIHDHMQKLPICKPYFSMLGVIHFLSCYLSTLKKYHKMPDLAAALDQNPKGCPPLFPHLPITIQGKEPIRLNLSVIVQNTIAKIPQLFRDCFESLYSHLNNHKPLKDFQFEKENELLKAFATQAEANFLKNCSPAFRKFLEPLKDNFSELTSEVAKNIFSSCLQAFNEGVKEYWKLPSDRRVGHQKLIEKFVPLLSSLFESKLIEASKPIPFQSTVINSQAPKDTVESNKRIVGGCGLRMEKKGIQASKVSEEIEHRYWKELSSLQPESWDLIDISRSKRAVFGLRFGDIPADLPEDYSWMERSLLIAPDDPEMKLAKGMIQLQEAMDTEADNNNDFVKLVDSFKPADLQKMHDREGASLLAYAAMHKNRLFLDTLLPKISPLTPDRYGYLPIHYAAMKDNLEAVKLLHSKAPESLKKGSLNRSTPLTVALLHGAKSVAKYCLDHHPVLAELTDGYTDLHCAVHEGNPEIISLLLKYDKAIKPCLNICSDEGGTPLMLACELDDPNHVKTLIEKGADVNPKRRDGLTAIEIAVKRDCFPVFEILLEKTQLTSAILETILKEGTIEMIEALATKLSNFNDYTNKSGETPAHIAIRHGNLPALSFLALKFPDMFKKKNKEEQLPIHLLLKVSAWDVLGTLFTKHGIIPDVMTLLEANFHPLMEKMLKLSTLEPTKFLDYLKIAGRRGNHQAITSLLNHKDISIENLSLEHKIQALYYFAIADAYSPFEQLFSQTLSPDQFKLKNIKTLAYIAAENNSLRVLFFLLQWMKTQKISLDAHDQDRHLFYPLIASGHVQAIKQALLIFPDAVNASLDKQRTKPVQLAIKLGLKAVFNLLISKGASILERTLQSQGCLSFAIQLRQEKMIPLLLDKNSPIEAVDLYEAAKREDKTLDLLLEKKPPQKFLDQALFIAIERFDREAVLHLHQKGASFLHIQSGVTTLLLASQLGQSKILGKIIQELSTHAPQQLKAFNPEGDNALHLACKNGHVSCIISLLQAGFDPHLKNGKGKSAFDLVPPKKFLSVLLKSPKEGQALLEKFMKTLKSGDLKAIEQSLTYFSGNELLPYEERNEATALQLAVQCAQVTFEEVMSWLKGMPSSVNVPDSNGDTLAHYLVREDISPVEIPFINLQAVNHKGQTVLHVATKKTSEFLFKGLMVAIKNIDTPDEDGYTPLFYSILREDEKKSALLIEGKANLEHSDKNGMTALLHATRMNRLSHVKLLVEAGANMNILGTPKRVSPLLLSIGVKHQEITRYLLFKGAKTCLAGEDGYLPIHAAAEMGEIDFFRLLSINRQSLILPNKQGKLAVHFAALHGHKAIIKYVKRIDEKAINRPIEGQKHSTHEEKATESLDEATPLHLAAFGGHLSTVDWLLKHGADPELATKNNHLPHVFGMKSSAAPTMFQLFEPYAFMESVDHLLSSTTCAIGQDSVSAMQLAYQKGIPINWHITGKNTGLHIASYTGAFQCTKWLLQAGSDPFLTNDEDQNAFEIAASNGFHEQFKLLLTYACPDLDAPYSHGQTLLHIAIRNGQFKNVLVLFKLGAALNTVELTGTTPLHYAVRENKLDIVKLLLILGADPAIASKYGKTAKDYAESNEMKDVFHNFELALKQSEKSDSKLHLAARLGDKWATWLLLDDEDVDTKNSSETTPLHVAIENEHENVTLILLQNGANPLAKNKEGDTPISIAKRKPLLVQGKLLKMLENS